MIIMDLSWIASWFNDVSTFFTAMWDFVNSGIYQFFKDALVVIVKALVYSSIEFKIFCLGVAYDVVNELVQDTGAADLVKSAWGSLSADVQSTLAFFNVPQGLSLIFAAFPTKWAMKFIPGSG